MFLLEVDDSLNSINFIDSTAKQLSKIGGGVAINLSKLRARGEAIKGIKGVAKGVLPVAKALEGGFSYAIIRSTSWSWSSIFKHFPL